MFCWKNEKKGNLKIQRASRRAIGSNDTIEEQRGRRVNRPRDTAYVARIFDVRRQNKGHVVHSSSHSSSAFFFHEWGFGKLESVACTLHSLSGFLY